MRAYVGTNNKATAQELVVRKVGEMSHLFA